MERPQKVMVIGAVGLDQQGPKYQVQAYSWDSIRNIVNLSDSDTIIINLLSLPDPNLQDFTPLIEILNPYTALVDILSHGGRFIIIGNPNFTISWTNRANQEIDLPFLWWTGLSFEWDERRGNTIVPVKGLSPEYRKYDGYMSNVKTYEVTLRRCTVDDHHIDEAFNLEELRRRNITIEETVSSLAVTRYGGKIAFSVHLRLLKHHGRNSVYLVTQTGDAVSLVTQTGNIVVLPKSQLDSDESLALILRDVFGIEVSAQEPKWAAEMIVEGEKPINMELARIASELNVLNELKRRAESERAAVRQPLRLLYDTGAGLEEVVLDALEKLGATVTRPTSPGMEDGWVKFETQDRVLEGVLEIKGTRSRQFREDGLKQVITWVARGVELQKKKFKGIFIGNADIGKPPSRRGSAFSSGFQKNAELHQIVAIKSEDLYRCLELNRLGRLNVSDFWRELFGANGVYDCPTCEAEPAK